MGLGFGGFFRVVCCFVLSGLWLGKFMDAGLGLLSSAGLWKGIESSWEENIRVCGVCSFYNFPSSALPRLKLKVGAWG